MVDFPVFQPQSFANALYAGSRAGYDVARARRQNELDQRADQAQQYVEPAMNGDQGAFIKLATANPQAGNAVASMLGRMDAQKKAALANQSAWTAQTSSAILAAPPEQRPALWAQALKEAQGQGIDVSHINPEYSDAQVKFYRDRAIDVTKQYEMEANRPQPMPGGAPTAAPAGTPMPGGFSGKVASGESGGNYTVSNGQGSGAYGRYQFMPDTWATVASANPQLNLPFNMKQATPQQQEQAFQALTQMNGAGLQKNGLPVSEQSLYLAHRFGVQGATAFSKAPDNVQLSQIFPASWIQQNPDLQGVTVGQFKQGVLSRFNQAPIGQNVDVAATPPAQMPNAPPGVAVAGAPAQMPQPQLAGSAAPPNANGQGDSVPPVAPPANGPAQDPGDPRTQGGVMMGVKGVPVMKDGYQLFRMPDGSMQWYKPTNRNPQNPPSGYRWITGPDGKQALEAIPGGPAAPGGTSNPQGLTGDDFIATLPADRAAQVKALYEGRMALSPRLQASQQGKQLMSDLMNAYPNDYDSILSGQRQKTAGDFAVGTAAKNITALNTAIQHLGELHDLAGKLNNFSGLNVINTVKNFAAKETGDPDITNFNIAKHAVSEELSRVFKGQGISDAEIKAWEDKINYSMGPKQLQGVLDEATKLMNGRIEALGDQYSRGMGKSVPAISLLSPEAQKTLQRIQDNPIGSKPAEAPQASSNGSPVKVQTPEEAMKLPPGTQFITPDGRLKVRP